MKKVRSFRYFHKALHAFTNTSNRIGRRKITKQIIKKVASDSLRLVKPMLEALKSGIPSEIAKYEDIRPIDIDEEVEKYKASIDMQKKIRIQKKLQRQKCHKRNSLFGRSDTATFSYGF